MIFNLLKLHLHLSYKISIYIQWLTIFLLSTLFLIFMQPILVKF